MKKSLCRLFKEAVGRMVAARTPQALAKLMPSRCLLPWLGVGHVYRSSPARLGPVQSAAAEKEFQKQAAGGEDQKGKGRDGKGKDKGKHGEHNMGAEREKSCLRAESMPIMMGQAPSSTLNEEIHAFGCGRRLLRFLCDKSIGVCDRPAIPLKRFYLRAQP